MFDRELQRGRAGAERHLDRAAGTTFGGDERSGEQLLRDQHEWLATAGSHCRTAVQVIASPLTVAKKAHWRRRLSPNSMVRYRVARPGGVKTDGGGTNTTASLVLVPSAAIEEPFRSL